MVVPLNFNTLSRADQADLLLAEGVFLGSGSEGGFIVDRYRLHDFYVEIYFNNDTNEAIAVKSFYPRQQHSPIYQMQVPRLSVRKGA
jgi:hypothetical protein